MTVPKVRGSILKIEKVNFNNNKQIELFGYAISAKRYDLYRYDAQGNIVIVDAKAHGLGYLYPQTSIAGRRVDHITRDHIALLVVGSSPANTNNALRTLRRMLKKAHEWEMIRSVPVVKLVEEHGREELIEPWMEANLLAVTEIPRTPNSKHAPKSINYGWQPFRDVLLIMLDTGMRPAEVFPYAVGAYEVGAGTNLRTAEKVSQVEAVCGNHRARQGGIAGA